jgi:hypothetical protein
MGDVERYVKCIREIGTDITPGKIYKLIYIRDNVIRFLDDDNVKRSRPLKSHTHILYEFVSLEEMNPTEETSCL